MAIPAEVHMAAAMSLAAAAKAHSMALGRQATAALVKSTCATLELGAQADGRGWETGCARLGVSARTSVFTTRPTMDQLVAFFRTPCEWIYISGHYLGSHGQLYSRDGGVSDGGTEIDFFDDAVDVTVPGETRRLTKAGGDFRLHLGCALVVLAACSGLRVDSRIRTLRALFGNPVLLSYGAGTNAGINNTMMGGGGLVATSFFGRLRSKRAQNDPNAARDAWMETANANYGGGALEDRFRAVDADGQEWMLSGKTIVKGRKL
jgi:hypothetical protein